MRHLLLLPVVGLLLACSATSTTRPTSTPALGQLPTLPPLPATTTVATAATTAAPNQWQQGAAGVELRQMAVVQADQPPASLLVVRIDPAQVRLRVGYAPDQPRSLRAWARQYQPLVAINGGFFTPEYHSTALVISDGVASGSSYTGFGGMLAVTPQGEVSLRPLRDQPYDAGESLDQAMQSFPMLVFPGGQPAELADNNERARRTVLAQDHAGRLLVIVTPGSVFTLGELAAWLVASDLEIERALNMDGGSSTGLYLNAGALRANVDAFGPLPLVLFVEARQ